MPLDQHIEGGHGEREPRLKIGPHAVHDPLEMTDERQHGEHRLDEYIPTTPLDLALGLSPLPMRKISAMVTSLHPLDQRQDFFNGIRP
jgi:hypothetical protein